MRRWQSTRPAITDARLAGMLAAMVLADLHGLLRGLDHARIRVVLHRVASCWSAASSVRSRMTIAGSARQVQRLTASNVREIFIPNPPTMALMALPLVGARRAAGARRLAHRVAAAASSPAWPRSCSYPGTRNRDVSIPVMLLMLLAPAVFTNLRIGQGYLIVFALVRRDRGVTARGTRSPCRRRASALLALKTSGVAMVLVADRRRRWVALAAAASRQLCLAIGDHAVHRSRDVAGSIRRRCAPTWRGRRAR